MAVHTLSEPEFYQWMNESLARLESQLQTFNELRSIRTAWEAPQTHIQSPPASVPPLPNPTPPSIPKIVQNVMGTPKPILKTAQKTTPFPHEATPKPTPSLGAANPPSFSRTNSESLIYPNALMISIFEPTPCEYNKRSLSVSHEAAVKEANLEHEWMPPWYFVMTLPYASGEREWRPPWKQNGGLFVLTPTFTLRTR